MFSVWAVGVLLVTALLIVPAATARNLARTAGGMFWWSILVSVTSAVAGAGALRTGMVRDSHRSDRCPRLLRLVSAERRSCRHTGEGRRQ